MLLPPEPSNIAHISDVPPRTIYAISDVPPRNIALTLLLALKVIRESQALSSGEPAERKGIQAGYQDSRPPV